MVNYQNDALAMEDMTKLPASLEVLLLWKMALASTSSKLSSHPTSHTGRYALYFSFLQYVIAFISPTSIEKVCRSVKGCEKSFAMKCFVFL